MSQKPALIKLIDAFCDMYETAEFSFARYVLADYALENKSITMTLGLGAKWLDTQIDEIYKDEDLNAFERNQKIEIEARRLSVFTAFLHFLLSIPEDVRIASAAVYQGVPHEEILLMIGDSDIQFTVQAKKEK